MKRFFKYISVFTLIILTMSLAVGCSKKKAEPPVTDIENELPGDLTDEDLDQDSPDNTEDEVEGENSGDTMSLELGNDMGKDITNLYLRADADDSWNEIKLTNNLWRTGYLIPIELEAEELPAPADGWEIRVVFSDGTEQIFTGVDLNNNASVILTADGAIY